MKLDVRDIYKNLDQYMNQEVVVSGWIRNHRKQKEFGFIDFSDGTYFKNIQVVYDNKLEDFDEIQKLRVGCAIEVRAEVISSPAKGQEFELSLKKMSFLGCPVSRIFPLFQNILLKNSVV